jgi:hypothetical protein
MNDLELTCHICTSSASTCLPSFQTTGSSSAPQRNLTIMSGRFDSDSLARLRTQLCGLTALFIKSDDYSPTSEQISTLLSIVL